MSNVTTKKLAPSDRVRDANGALARQEIVRILKIPAVLSRVHIVTISEEIMC